MSGRSYCGCHDLGFSGRFLCGVCSKYLYSIKTDSTVIYHIMLCINTDSIGIIPINDVRTVLYYGRIRNIVEGCRIVAHGPAPLILPLGRVPGRDI